MAQTAIIPEPDWDLEYPWTRQPCDDERSWVAFVCFRDSLPPRTLLGVSKITGDSISLVRKWSRQNAWEDRVFFYDRWVDQCRSEQVAKIIGEDAVDRALRHIGLLRGMQEIVAATLSDWLARVRKGEVVVENPKDIIKALKDTITLERLVAGETTAKAEIKAQYDLSNLSVQDLDALVAIQDKVQTKT